MFSIKHIAVLFCLVFSLVFCLPFAAIAGSSQPGDVTFFKPEEIVSFSKSFERSLAENRARVAIVARAGRYRDQLPEGVSFTHVAFAVYSQITTRDGRKIPGYAMYNLYQKSDKPDSSYLVQDYPVDFFAGVKVLEAGVIIPKPKVQMALVKVIASPAYQSFHNPRYSVIANPYTLDLQNCTEHTLDIIFAAVYGTDKIAIIKENQKAYFKALPIKMNPFLISIGSIFISEIAVSDHPENLETATFNTIADFMDTYHLTSKRYIFTGTTAGNDQES